jgi:hypothetical protein
MLLESKHIGQLGRDWSGDGGGHLRWRVFGFMMDDQS